MMLDTREQHFIRHLTYLYGAVAVSTEGVLRPPVQRVLERVIAEWLPSVRDSEIRDVMSPVLTVLQNDAAEVGPVLYGVPRFVDAGMGLSVVLDQRGRRAAMHDLCLVALGDGIVSPAQAAMLSALERAWQTGIPLPMADTRAGAHEAEAAERALGPVGESARVIVETAEAPPAEAFGTVTGKLPAPREWWFDHLGGLTDATVEKNPGPASRTGKHRQLWAEASAWVDALIASVFAESGVNWVNNPNQYQIGKLSYTYWARVYPEGIDDLADTFHLGLQISKRIKWVDTTEPALTSAAAGPVMVLWASTNDRLIERSGQLDLYRVYADAQRHALLTQPELWQGGGALVRVHQGQKAHLVRAATYLGDPVLQTGRASVFSPLITPELVARRPQEAAQLVANYLRLLAEPLLAARAHAGGRSKSPARRTPVPVSAQPTPAVTAAAKGAVPSQVTDLAERIRGGESVTVPFRLLLSWFGAARRGAKVLERVESALAAAGIRPSNRLDEVAIDTAIRFEPIAGPSRRDLPGGGSGKLPDPGAGSGPSTADDRPPDDGADEDHIRAMGQSMHEILTSVSARESFDSRVNALAEALGIDLEDDDDAESDNLEDDDEPDGSAPADTDAQEGDDDDDVEAGFPALRLSKASTASIRELHRSNLKDSDIMAYPRPPWVQPTKKYANKLGVELRVPQYIDEILAAHRRLTPLEVDRLVLRIQRYRVIPSLSFAPARLREQLNGVWWFHPLMVVAEQFAAWVAADEDGLHTVAEDGTVLFGVRWDRVVHYGVSYKAEARLWSLQLIYDIEADQYVTVEEFVAPGCGPHLMLLDAIAETYWPTVEASRGQPMWLHGSGDETVVEFQSWEELLGDDESPWHSGQQE